MKLNQDKCHFIVSRHEYESVLESGGFSKTWENNDQELLEVNLIPN